MTETHSETDGTEPDTPRGWRPFTALAVAVIVLAMSAAITIAVTAILLPVFENTDSFLDKEFLERAGDGKLLIASFAGLLVAQLIGCMVILLLARQRKGNRNDTLFLRSPHGPLRVVLAAVGFMVGAAALLFGIFAIWPFDLTAAVREFVLLAQSSHWPLAVLVLALGAPLYEEFLFRGFLLSSLQASALGPLGAAIITSAIWTLIHWGYAVQALLGLFVMGLALAALVRRTGSIWYAIAAHATYNSCAFIYYRWFVTLV